MDTIWLEQIIQRTQKGVMFDVLMSFLLMNIYYVKFQCQTREDIFLLCIDIQLKMMMDTNPIITVSEGNTGEYWLM